MTNFEHLQQKILQGDALDKQLSHWRKAGKKLVFTNGCFDLLHYGHIHYLSAAADLGDCLIIGLNSDASVQRLKGKNRPIKDEKNRAHLLAALAFVDAVVIFEQDTPYELIQQIQPDVLVKGGDWKPADIIGSDIVQAGGGLVRSLPFVEGYSTTRLEDKIKRQ